MSFIFWNVSNNFINSAATTFFPLLVFLVSYGDGNGILTAGDEEEGTRPTMAIIRNLFPSAGAR